MYDTVRTMSTAPESVQKHGREVHGGVFGSTVLRKVNYVKGGVGYLVHSGVCLLSKQVSKEAERAGAVLLAEHLLVRVLAELFSGK